MAVIFSPGSTFRILLDSGDVSAQVTSGSGSRSTDATEVYTLTDKVVTGTKVSDSGSFDFLYDDVAAGVYDTLWDAAGVPGSTLDVEISAATRKWVGTIAVSNVDYAFAAEDGASTASCSYIGTFTRAAVTP
jgi:hypothetical protein